MTEFNIVIVLAWYFLLTAHYLNNAAFPPVQRSVYKDLVLILQKDAYLSSSQLRSKVSMSVFIRFLELDKTNKYDGLRVRKGTSLSEYATLAMLCRCF